MTEGVDLEELRKLAEGECRYCDKGFPVKAGVHYPTQALGMIPNAACEKYSGLLERRKTVGAEPAGATEWRATTLALIAELTELRAQAQPQGWVACSERMPTEQDEDEHGFVNVFAPARGVDMACWDGVRWLWRSQGYALPSEVTHFQPLPTPPEATDG